MNKILKKHKSQSSLLQGKTIEKGLHFAMQNFEILPTESIYNYTLRYYDKYSHHIPNKYSEPRRKELYLLIKKGITTLKKIKGVYMHGPSIFNIKIGEKVFNCRSDFNFKRNSDKICIELKVTNKNIIFPTLNHIKQTLKYSRATHSKTTLFYLSKIRKNKKLSIKSTVFDIWEYHREKLSSKKIKNAKLITCYI